jgi:hypothetical protein
LEKIDQHGKLVSIHDHRVTHGASWERSCR